ncbi:hypothetical protein JTB14_008874 [Gonioctena quinquepunctata]|nr:hypothetical protein JTB14_008874 [Gonioctena quinquepunctata]
MSSVSSLIDSILPSTFSETTDNFFYEAVSLWLLQTNLDWPPATRNIQKSWDLPLLNITSKNLLDSSKSEVEKARLRSVSIKESGAWLNALPVLEPPGTSRDDGKRPDGMTLIPWKCGKPLVWDFTCADTVAASHLANTSKSSGAAAISSEKLKRKKYQNLGNNYLFHPITVETFGVFGP